MIKLALSSKFGNFILLAILANALTMSLTWPHQSQDTIDAIDTINQILTLIFVLEMIIKHLGLGLEVYWGNPWNVFDGIIVILSVFEYMILIAAGGGGASDISALRAFRLFRVFRLLRLLRRFEALKRQVEMVIRSVGGVVWLMALLMLFIFMFAVLGLSLFAGKFDKSRGSRWRFDNIYLAMLVIYQCMTGDSWRSVVADSVQVTSDIATLYYCLIILMGNFIILNIFVAILLSNMSDPSTDEQKLYNYLLPHAEYYRETTDMKEEEAIQTLLDDLVKKQDEELSKKTEQYYQIANEELSWLKGKNFRMLHSLDMNDEKASDESNKREKLWETQQSYQDFILKQQFDGSFDLDQTQIPKSGAFNNGFL